MWGVLIDVQLMIVVEAFREMLMEGRKERKRTRIRGKGKWSKERTNFEDKVYNYQNENADAFPHSSSRFHTETERTVYWAFFRLSNGTARRCGSQKTPPETQATLPRKVTLIPKMFSQSPFNLSSTFSAQLFLS
jgi:hypothetical protein